MPKKYYTYEEMQELKRLIEIAKSPQNQYDGTTEQFENIQVTIDKQKKKLVITYILVKGKRTIKKTFSVAGIKYKIYNDWEYTRSQKKYIVFLTEEFLTGIMHDTTPIICEAREKILLQIPLELKPEELIRQEIEAKYSKKAKLQIQTQTENEKQALILLVAEYGTIYHEYQIAQNDKEDYISEMKVLKEKVEKIRTKFFFFNSNREKAIKKNQKSIDLIQEKIDELDVYIAQLFEKLEQNTNQRKSLMNKFKKRSKEILAQIEQEKNKELVTLLESKRKIITTTITSIDSTGKPNEDWQKEERAKLNRLFQNGLTLREWILQRDNYTCKQCGNSIQNEPNLLLEVDHICPVSKWGPSLPQNLQTLCWKCNRSKSNKT